MAFIDELDKELQQTLANLERQSSDGDVEKIDVPLLLTIALKNELEATEEAAMWLAREPDLEVKLALARQCGDEARHYRLIEARLHELGVEFSPPTTEPSRMFEYLASLPTTVERVAAGPYAREGLALTRNRVFIDYCLAQGDGATAGLYRDVIQPDEQHHHGLGRRLLARLCTTPELEQKAAAAVRRTLQVAGELQEIARLQRGLSRIPGC